MRYIDKERLVNCKTKTWDRNSRRWLGLLRSSDEPVEKIKDIGNKWTLLKGLFVEEYGAKCWYTEAPQVGTDCDIDHFWPKGRVKDADGNIIQNADNERHPGYWWKAYDIENYRHSSIFANRAREGGGKVDYFPLTDEGKRAWVEGDCDYESRLILDPCSIDDVKLITFELEPGKTMPVPELDEDSDEYQRVVESRTLLNLDEATIVSNRLDQIRSVKNALQIIRISSKIPDDEYDDEDVAGLERAKQTLIRACSRTEKFSAAAVECIMPYRNVGYLADILDQLDLMP